MRGSFPRESFSCPKRPPGWYDHLTACADVVLMCGYYAQASERVIDRATGKLERFFHSNAPVGHYRYAYPVDMQTQRKNFGAMIFYHRAQFIGGQMKLQTKLYTDFAWIARYTTLNLLFFGTFHIFGLFCRDEVGEYFDEKQADFFKHLL